MNISCDVIKDILPLYAENMVSQATRKLVDEHLCDCAVCTELLGQLLKKDDIPAETNSDALMLVKKAIRKRKLLAVLTCFFLTAAVALGAFAFLTRPIYLTAEEAEVRLVEDGDKINFEFGDAVDCFSISTVYDEAALDVTITAYRRLWNVHYGSMNNYRVDRENGDFRWGVTNGGQLRRISYGNAETGREDELLWGQAPLEHSISLPRLVLNYYVLIAITAAVIFAVAGWLLRHKKYGKAATAAAMLFLSYAAGSYIVMGGNLLVYATSDLPWYLGMITACTFLLWGAELCVWRAWLLRCKDGVI